MESSTLGQVNSLIIFFIIIKTKLQEVKYHLGNKGKRQGNYNRS